MKPETPASRNPLFYLGLLLIITVIITAQVGAFLQLRSLLNSNSNQTYLAVSTLINYGHGNGTSRWHNLTDVPAGWNFYQLTVRVANTETSTSLSLPSEHFIIGLDGVRNAGASWWTIWTLCQKDNAWTASRVGADLINLKNGDIMAWYYQAPPSINAATWDPPVPGATKVATCTP